MDREYYLDSCIWLNLFKKEGDATKGIPYWKSAKDFIEKVAEKEEKIIVSTIVLKELYFTVENKFEFIKSFFRESEFVDIIKTTHEDYDLAREWEKKDKELSFYDYIHVAIAKRLKIPLITRDGDLIRFARNYVEVFKPEELLG